MSVWNGNAVTPLKVVYDTPIFKRIVTGDGEEGSPSESELEAGEIKLDQPASPVENIAKPVAYFSLFMLAHFVCSSSYLPK